MKRTYKKIVVFLLIIITILNLFSTYSLAAFDPGKAFASQDSFGEALGDGILDILTFKDRLIVIAFGYIGNAIVKGITILSGSDTGNAIASPADIIFNQVELVKIDFFNQSAYSDANPAKTIQQGIATWYYILRNISIIILLVILIYIGIRMAISTVASDEAKYKKMLKDWFVSFILIFVLQYYMIFVININNLLVDNVFTPIYQMQQSSDLSETMQDLFGYCWSTDFSVGWGCAIAYLILSGITLMFLIMYIMRMITVAFLMMIAPLITITYSLDKMGDGKSQALNTWLKEFTYNILIQPFHCVIYLAITSTAIQLLIDSGSIASAALAIVMLVFIFKAEDIVKKIFGFQASSLGSTVAAGALGLTAFSALKNKGKKASENGKIPKMDSNLHTSNFTTQSAMPTQQAMQNMQNVQQQMANPTNGYSVNWTNTNIPQNTTPTSNPIQTPQRNFAQRAGKRVGATAKSYFLGGEAWKKALQHAGSIGGAALGAATGNMKGVIAGYSGGKGFSNMVQGKIDNNPIKEVRNERKFAAAYQDWSALQGSQNPEDLDAKVKQLMKMDKNRITNASDFAFREKLDNMQETYIVRGNKKSEDKLMSTIENVRDGYIKPKRSRK